MYLKDNIKMPITISEKSISVYNEMLAEISTYITNVKQGKIKKTSLAYQHTSDLHKFLQEFLRRNSSLPGIHTVSIKIKSMIRSLDGIKNGLDVTKRADKLEEIKNNRENAIKSLDPESKTYDKDIAELNKRFDEKEASLDDSLGLIESYTQFRSMVSSYILRPYNKIKETIENFQVESESPESDHHDEVDRISREQGPKAALKYLFDKTGTPVKKEEPKTNSDYEYDEQQSRKVLRSLEREKSKIPTSLRGKAFKVLNLPVVTNFQSPILNSVAHARKSGIKVVSFDTGHQMSRMRGGTTKSVHRADDIAVFLDQPILAFDINYASDDRKKVGLVSTINRKKANRQRSLNKLNDELELAQENYKKTRNRDRQAAKEYKQQIDKLNNEIQQLSNKRLDEGSLRTRKQLSKDQTSIQNFLLEFMEILNKTSPTKYEIVSDHYAVNPANPNIRFAWLMPKHTFRSFTRGSSNLKGTWNFPWKSEKLDVL